MMCVEDYLDTLRWAERIGGLDALMARADANAKVLYDWVDRTPWVECLAVDPKTRSNTSVCMRVIDPVVRSLPAAGQAAFARGLVETLDALGVAYDIGSYRDAPTGLRIWTGATVEAADLAALTPWLEWAFAEARRGLA
jgi:phosphoserine aminotransferase